MNEPICDTNGLHFLNPVLYTPQFLFNKYTVANNLAEHLHVFGMEISHMDYSLIGSLTGNIRTLVEDHREQVFDGAVRSNPYELWKTAFFFNGDLELVKKITEDDYEKTEVVFDRTLKKPQSLEIVKSTNGKLWQRRTVFFDSTLNYEKIEEFNNYDQSVKLWENKIPVAMKYLYRPDGTILKTIRTNTAEEQSKTSIEYNEIFQVQEVKSFDQKNKSEMLYDASFLYEKTFLKKVTFTKFKDCRPGMDNRRQEFTFEYNQKGLLTKFDDGFFSKNWEYDDRHNPVCIEEYSNSGETLWKTLFDYEYDKYNNWITKTTGVYKVNNDSKVEKRKSVIIRQYDYF